MRKLLNYIIIICLSFTLLGCKKTLKGTDALIDKAREESSIVDNIEITYGGLVAIEDTALIWFVSGNDNQEHTYLPMECNIVGKNEYTYVRTYKPMIRGNDIAISEWQNGYSFIINNLNCKKIRIIDNSDIIDISIDKDVYPFVYHHELIPTEYEFLDENGNVIY